MDEVIRDKVGNCLLSLASSLALEGRPGARGSGWAFVESGTGREGGSWLV